MFSNSIFQSLILYIQICKLPYFLATKFMLYQLRQSVIKNLDI